MYDPLTIRPLEHQQQQQQQNFASSPPLSSSAGASFNHHHIRTEPEQQQQQQLVPAKQESIDYYYNGGAAPSSSNGTAIQGHHGHQVAYLENAGSVDSGIGSSSGVFPPFYSLNQATPRRTDEMLSGYRLPGDCMFNETLDLSHDDIQRTLSANLSHETAFLCGPVEDRRPPDVPVPTDDDLLVNLDAFDMLAEFSDLDCPDAIDELAIHHQPQQTEESAGPAGKQQRAAKEPERPLTEISDFSPEWAPTEVSRRLARPVSISSFTVSCVCRAARKSW